LTTENLRQINEQSLEIDFAFSGSYDQVARFLKVLENLSYVAKINSFTLAEGQESRWNADVSMSVTLPMYEN
jgi:hypothetical protein